MLPIDPLLPEIVRSLKHHQCLVLEAPPGAGKTTRVPRALYEARPDDARQVIVTEPRRLAVRLAAAHVAKSMNTAVGEQVGYSVRFEDKTSARTRLRYVTEGVLSALLLEDPELSNVHTVILDEFHERHLATDELLALITRLCERRRDLRLVVMSATLEAAPIAHFLGDCPRVRSEGKSYAVTVRYQQGSDDRSLDRRVGSAVKDVLAEQSTGHVLVFLPGAREIRFAQQLLETRFRESIQPNSERPELHVLHGELGLDEQAAAIAPSRRRKVILATNVAESSVTIDGVTAVIDSGLARVAGHSPYSGRATLETAKISQSSAVQRAGRAGRTAPGLVVRLYEEADYRRRPERDIPEIQRLDLTDFVLRVLGMGLSVDELRWLDAPSKSAVCAALELLRRLDALDTMGLLTDVGRRMLRFPLAPRLARTIVSAERYGIADRGCLAAALLAERDLRQPPRGQDWDLPTGLSDVEERIDVFREAAENNFRPHILRSVGLERVRVQAVARAYRQLRRIARDAQDAPTRTTGLDEEARLRRSLLHGFCDRVALHQGRSHRLILQNGTQANVAPTSIVRDAPFVLALEVEERTDERGSAARVQWLSAIEPDWLLEDYADRIELSEVLRFDSDKLRVEAVSKISYGSVTLDESRRVAAPSPEAAQLLFEAACQKKTALFGKRSSLDDLAARVALLRDNQVGHDWPAESAFDDEALLRAASETVVSFAELFELDFAAAVLRGLSREQQAMLREQTPAQLTLAGGRHLDVKYERDKPPWVASRLQDFFGSSDGPRICSGRVPLTLHLLAPNQRAVQVTSDLSGFWERHYHDVRKELRRRYPRHPWPEDGRIAEPPAPREPRPPRKR